MDVVEGRGPVPLLVLSLIEGLQFEPNSMLRAHLLGGPEFIGWDEERNILASIYDAINTNTTATGQWKKGKTPDIPAWPRPGESRERGKKKVSVKDLYTHFQRK